MEQHLQIPINQDAPKKGVVAFLRKVVIEKSFNHPAGIIALLLVGLYVARTTATSGFVPGVMLILLLVAAPLLYALICYPQFGITILLVGAYLLMWVIKFGVPFPIGTLMDGMEALLLIGLLLKIKFNGTGGVYKNPVSKLIIAWVLYNLMQIGNPAAESRMSWVFTIRSVAMVMLMYFVFVYHIRTESFLKFIIKLWLLLSVFAALYAFWQEYVDFLPFEKAGLENPDVRMLLFINGHWRKFSIFSDPVAFSYNMVASALLCVGLATAKKISKRKKILLIFLACLFTNAMLFSGTRGAYGLIPVGLALLAVIKMNRQVFIMSIAGLMAMLVVIFIPTSNPTLVRFQSAFKPSDDASFNVRKANQKRIQPYILTHPMGGGLGSTGAWGQRFAPGSYLASFPPDSGYVRVAVELGPIGLLLFCSLIFMALRTGIDYYYNMKDDWLKSVCLAMLIVVFALSVGNYPQEAFVQFPNSIFLYLYIAILNITMRIDKDKQKTESL